MSTRLSLLVVASCIALPGLARADEEPGLTPEKVAEIRRDEAQALGKVDAEFGNRKPSEMSSEERGQAIQKQQAASAEVLEKHGVSAKEYARYEARMTPEDNARAAAEEKRLEAQASAAKAAGDKPAGDGEIPIQQGFSDEDPVELETAEGAEPVVEAGLPGENPAADVPVETGEPADEVKPAKRAATKAAVRKRASKRRGSRDD